MKVYIHLVTDEFDPAVRYKEWLEFPYTMVDTDGNINIGHNIMMTKDMIRPLLQGVIDWHQRFKHWFFRCKDENWLYIDLFEDLYTGYVVRDLAWIPDTDGILRCHLAIDSVSDFSNNDDYIFPVDFTEQELQEKLYQSLFHGYMEE